MGNGIKAVEKNEENTVIIQRRSIRVTKNLLRGELLTDNVISMLRPCPSDALEPWELDDYLGRKLARDLQEGDYLKSSDF